MTVDSTSPTEFDAAVKMVVRLLNSDGAMADLGKYRQGDIAAGYIAGRMVNTEGTAFIDSEVTEQIGLANNGDPLADAACRLALVWAWRNQVALPAVLAAFAANAILSDRPKFTRNKKADNAARDSIIAWAIHRVLDTTGMKATRNVATERRSACDVIEDAMMGTSVGEAIGYKSIAAIWNNHLKVCKAAPIRN